MNAQMTKFVDLWVSGIPMAADLCKSNSPSKRHLYSISFLIYVFNRLNAEILYLTRKTTCQRK